MWRLGLVLAFCLSLTGAAFAQGGMGPGPGMVHSTGGGGGTPVDLGNIDGSGGGVTTVTTNPLLASVATGKLVVAFCSFSNTTTPVVSVTDTKSNTYTAGPKIQSNFSSYIYYSFITTPLTTSDTITCHDTAATGFQNAWLSAVSASGYTAHDAATDNSNSNGFATTYSVTGAGSASVANELYFGFSISNSTFPTPPTGWTSPPPSTPNTGFLAGYQINTGTTALTWNGSTAGAQFTNSLIVSFK